MSRGPEPVAPRQPVAVVAFARRFALEIGLALLVVVLFADYLFSDLLLYGSDSIPSGLFFRTLLVDFVREHGELPRWNPYILGGLPFLDATHGDTFFPSSVLHFLMPVYRALGHKLLLHIFLAGVFMAFYLRSLRLRPGAVVFGAVAYMLSPVFVSYLFTGQDGKMYVTSLAPLVFGLLERAMRSGRWATFVGLGLAIGFTILSAQIQMAYHAMWFLGALFLVRLVRGPAPAAPAAAAGGDEPRPTRLRGAIGFALALGLGLLVASIQLLPAVSYVKHPAGFSVRSDRTDYEHASSWSLHPEEIASMVVPEFCNAPRGYWGRNFFKYNSDSVGIVALFLAALALRRRRDATRWYLAGLAVFAVAYSLGGHTPLHRLFYWIVPQVKLFRAPPLVMFGAAFGVAALAAHAVHDLLTEEGPRGKGASRLPRGLALALAAAGLLAVVGLAAEPFTDFWNAVFRPPLDGGKADVQMSNLPDFRKGAIFAGILLAAAVGLVEARRRRALAVLPFVGILVGLTIVDEWRIDRGFRTLVEPDRWTEPSPLLRELAVASRTEKFRVAPAVASLANNEMGVFGIESTFGFHDNELAWYRELRAAPEAQNLFLGDDRGYPFLRFLNVGYILHDRPDLPNPLPVAGVLPRFRLVEDWVIESDHSAIPARLADPGFDVARTVVLEEDPGVSASPDGGDREGDEPGTVLSYSYDGNRILVTVDVRRPCLLVHAENWFPYWTAWRGEESVPILRANGAIRAIPLSAGRQELEIRFRSAPFELGKVISLTTLAFCGIFLLAARVVRRRDR